MAIPQLQRREDEEQNVATAGGCCKYFTKFLLSHIGLCMVVVLYAVAGGFIFQHLEQTNEQQECKLKMDKYNYMENVTVEELWRASVAFVNQYRSDNEDPEREQEALAEFGRYLVQFRDDTLELNYDGGDCDKMGKSGGPGYQWSLPGALLFSVTVITTIGKIKVDCLLNVFI